MNKVLQDNKVKALYRLHEDNETARRFLDWAAGRANDSTETSVERAASIARVDQSDMRQLFHDFESLGLGRIITGRKGYKTRFAWQYSLRSIGKISQRQAQILEDIDVNKVEPEDEDPKQTPHSAEKLTSVPEGLIGHVFQLRADLSITIPLPPDLTTKEAERLASWMRTLPFE